MLKRNQIFNPCLTESNRKIRKKHINIGIETKNEYKNFLSKKIKNYNLEFPNIISFQNNHGIKTVYNSNLFNKIIKNININSDYLENDSDIPKITSKINKKRNISVKNKKYISLINSNNYLDDIEKSNLVLSSIKASNFNILNENNISNINNIYNKKDYLKYYFTLPSNNNNDKSIIINNLKNAENNSSLKEDEKNAIQNILYNKATIKFNKKYNSMPKRIKRRDEFKEFLKEVLRQYKVKNTNKIKKKIEINTLLSNKKIKNNNFTNIIESNNSGFNEINLKHTKNEFRNDNNNHKFDSIIMRNKLLNTKINGKNKRLLCKEIKINKKRIFNMYKFKKNKIIINEVEEALINLENKIKNCFDKYKKNIDDEPTKFS